MYFHGDLAAWNIVPEETRSAEKRNTAAGTGRTSAPLRLTGKLYQIIIRQIQTDFESTAIQAPALSERYAEPPGAQRINPVVQLGLKKNDADGIGEDSAEQIYSIEAPSSETGGRNIRVPGE